MRDCAVMETENQLSWEKGITVDWLMQCLEDLQRDIRGFMYKKLFMQDYDRLAFVNRYYGGFTGFYKEVYQELVLYSIERLDKIPQNCTYKHIFWNLRQVMKKCLYRVSPEVYDFDIRNENGDNVGSFLENIPDVADADAVELQEQVQAIEYNRKLVRNELTRADLKPVEKSVLRYHYFEEMDYETICRKLKIGYASATSAHSNALQKMRVHFVINNISPHAN
ncbi:MAG: sigma-70 family RNA polymerase sigma factor [Bacteroidales bacterium]|nr:sigma-70 family RNA polymerase sigma factor [Bacteroidales bacterium]